MRFLSLTLVVAFAVSSSALAQEDDLAPLPVVKKPAAKPKPAPPPAARPKPAPAKPAPKPPVAEDDDLAPMPVAAGPGTLKVKIPAGLTRATLAVDTRDQGTLPLAEPLKLAAGEHSVLVKRIGYADFVKRVTIVSNKATDLDVKLHAVSAVLSVTSDVDHAEVYIDGNLVGTTPLADLELPAKTVELAVRKDGFKDSKRFVSLVAGQDYPLSIKFSEGRVSTVVATTDRPTETNLTPALPAAATVAVVSQADDAPLTSRWYFWAGVGAVVVAAAVGHHGGGQQRGASAQAERDRDLRRQVRRLHRADLRRGAVGQQRRRGRDALVATSRSAAPALASRSRLKAPRLRSG